MFHLKSTLEYRHHAVGGGLERRTATAAVQPAQSQNTQRELAAERALDAVLADSFPASDPPSWTLGISHSPSESTEDPTLRSSVEP